MTTLIRGLDCKVYVNTATYASPTWAEWPCVRDTTISIESQEIDGTCRGSGGWRRSAVSIKSMEISGSAIKDKTDPSFVAMELAARSETILDLLVLDGVRTSADSDGWRLDGYIFSWGEAQPYLGEVAIDFTIKPAVSANAPTAVAGPQPPA